MDRFYLVFIAIFGFFISQINCQIRREARWCTVNADELEKCGYLKNAMDERHKLHPTYPTGFKSYLELPELICKSGRDRFACMEMIYDNEADLVQLDPGMSYTAGQYFTMMPLMAEKYSLDAGEETGLTYYAVVVARKDRPDINYFNLKGKRACNPSVGNAAGWTYPISTLMQDNQMSISECNVPVKSAAEFFGPMCAPNGLARFYNPFGNNPQTVCQNCKGIGDNYCTGMDPYSGYEGAFFCMSSGDGDVAFVRDSTIYQAIAHTNSSIRPEDFELLCKDGKRVPVDQASTCNWGTIPSHVVMTSAIHDITLRDDYKMMMNLMSRDFGVGGTYTNITEMFSSVGYVRKNLLFSDETKSLFDVSKVQGGSRDTYYTWVGPEYVRRLEVMNKCPLQQARFCVISPYEMMKCENMIMAFSAKGLKPDLNCIMGLSIRDCMDKIRTGDADMIALNAADVYIAGKYYGLVPIAAEDYSGASTPVYYAVAVARRTESHLTIFNLKARRSCHAGVMTAEGWVVPVDKLIETAQIRVDDSNVYHAVGQFFSKSCVPGALNDFYNTKGTNPQNLCEACASGGRDRCQRNDRELYYGSSGAFRCLAEFGGDVAFVKHTTVRENTNGRNLADWARNRRSDDYELLCNDGTRRDIDQWRDCNMGEIPANAIVTAGFKTEEQRLIYWTLLNFGQQFFASDSNTEFSMFDSYLDHKDLIFQDSTVRLVPIEQENQNYEKFLGNRFIRSMERMEHIDRITAGSVNLCPMYISLFLSLMFAILLQK